MKPTSDPTQGRRFRKRSAGFMLLEVLVATTLLAVGVTAALNAIFGSLRASKSTQMFTQGFLLGQKVMSVAEAQVSFNDDFQVDRGWRDFPNNPLFQHRIEVEENMDFWTRIITVDIRWANHESNVENDDKNFYYRLATEVAIPRYPEDYRK